MSAVHPRTTSNPPAPWDEHDPYAATRPHSNSASQHMMHGPGRQRNDYGGGGGGGGENAVPVPGYGNGVDRKSSISHGQPQFDVARSPPTTSNKSELIVSKAGRRLLRLW
ncbi:hypothetical protein CLCR_11044 [Cladophialophora carrionii]|uniref:Uncharacterized protein n=1 Tax=Cladophialophora carrionii TaxID=86049 RepID=A0A1C1CWB7_9EURO|nr:hypothetical protein CLCR_11044 [Cladophialophora carrionii]